MYYHHDTQSVDMIDARESAPLAATRDMYNNETLSSIKGESISRKFKGGICCGSHLDTKSDDIIDARERESPP